MNVKQFRKAQANFKLAIKNHIKACNEKGLTEQAKHLRKLVKEMELALEVTNGEDVMLDNLGL